MKKLQISPDLSLPADAVTQTFAILAKRRVGKTYTASVMAEEMAKAGLPFVALDPTGAWWGLRSGADGNSDGLPVVIIGGAHGDLPLEPTAGKVIAELVVEHPGFYVIDLSLTESDAEQDRFATAFAQRLYRLKEKHRDPLHLFIDEADSFAPQKPFEGQKLMLGAFEALVRRGGIRGIGMTLITQRPAVLNKNVLNMTEAIIALQTTAPLDQDAVKDWVQRNATKEQMQQFMSSLASLKQGEAWFYSPAWLEDFKRIHIRQRETFNSSSTPKVGEKRVEPKRLAPVDIEQLKGKIADSIERAEANDPDKLKKEIARLNRELTKAQKELPTAVARVATKIERVEVPVLRADDAKHLRSTIEECFEWTKNFEESFVKRVVDEINGALARVSFELRQVVEAKTTPHVEMVRPPVQSKSVVKRIDSQTPRASSNGDGSLGKGERVVLTAVAQHQDGVTREQLTILTGYKRSTRDAYLQRMGQRGLVELYNGATITATEKGIQALGDFEPLPTGDELREYWLNKLPQGEALILEFTLRQYPNPIDRDVLSEKTGYARSSRDAYIQRLSARKLVIPDGRGAVKASPILFD